MNQFVETHKLLKLIQEESRNLNRPVSRMEIKSAMRNVPKQAQDKMTSLASLSVIESLHFPFSNTSREGRTPPNSLNKLASPQRQRQTSTSQPHTKRPCKCKCKNSHQ